MGMSVGNNGGDDAEYRPISEINITPMVDVMLVLLIIFMITAPLMGNKIPVELPKADNIADEAGEVKAVTVSIQDRGDGSAQLYWEEDPVQFEGMMNRLKMEAVKKPQPEFKIRADSTLQYKQVREVLASAKLAGIQKVGFVTTPAN